MSIAKKTHRNIVLTNSSQTTDRRSATASMLAGDIPGAGGGESVLRRQLAHDIRHELSTIKLLAALLSESVDLGGESRQRARHILDETRWLDDLMTAYDAALVDGVAANDEQARCVALDVIAAEVLAPIRMSTSTRVSLTAVAASADVDRLAFWRALRNLVGNALDAAGAAGMVAVSVSQVGNQVHVDVDDDGPGFDDPHSQYSSLGLGIVRELVASWGGHVRIGHGSLGGCGVRLVLPAADASRSSVHGVGA